jgi:hypothetical protein
VRVAREHHERVLHRGALAQPAHDERVVERVANGHADRGADAHADQRPGMVGAFPSSAKARSVNAGSLSPEMCHATGGDRQAQRERIADHRPGRRAVVVRDGTLERRDDRLRVYQRGRCERHGDERRERPVRRHTASFDDLAPYIVRRRATREWRHLRGGLTSSPS